MLPTNITELKNAILKGQTFEYELFWNGPFSQWNPAPFVIDGVTYPTTEHYMMAEKARLFGDDVMLEAIMCNSDPAIAKSAGRQVSPYNDKEWAASRFNVVVKGNIAKFKGERQYILLNTGSKILVEASPYDTIWGIGLGETCEDALDPFKWKGDNLLGFALMEAREFIRNMKP